MIYLLWHFFLFFIFYFMRHFRCTVYPIQYMYICIYNYTFILLSFVWVVSSLPVNFCNAAFPHIVQGYFTGTWAIIWLPQCQWSNPKGYGWIAVQYKSQQNTQQSAKLVCNCWSVLYDVCRNIVILRSRADSRFAPSQWETALLCNGVSHWLGTSLESGLEVTG